MEIGEEEIVRVRFFEAVPQVLPATVALTVYVPTVDGVPLMTPPVLQDRPDGRPEHDQEYVPLPPVAAKVVL